MNWNRISPRNFEKFVFHALKYEDFYDRKWMGGTGDRGRDVEAKKHIKLPFNLGCEQKWIFQCKRVKRIPTSGEIYNEVTTAKQHNPDVWVLVTPHNPTSNFYDLLQNFEGNLGMKLVVLSLTHLEEILFEHPELKGVLENGELPKGGKGRCIN